MSSDQRPDFGIVIDDDGVSKYLLHRIRPLQRFLGMVQNNLLENIQEQTEEEAEKVKSLYFLVSVLPVLQA